MRFADRLKVSSLFSFGLLAVLAPLLVWSSGEFQRSRANDLLADDILTLTFERTVLCDDYLLHGSERARLQWLALTERTRRMLQQADRQFDDREELAVVKEMHGDFNDTVAIFQRLAALAKGAGGDEKSQLVQHEELGKRLFSQILLKSSALRRDTARLQMLARARHDHGFNRNLALTALFVVMIGAVTLFNSTMITKLLRKRLHSLRSGAALIAAGDLDQRIDAEGSDELAELAQVLNGMTARVQHYTKQLEKSRDLLNDLSDQVPGVLFQTRLSPEGHFSTPYASKAIDQIYEFHSELIEADATPVFDTFHPDDRDGIIASIQESANTLQPWLYEYRVILPRQGVKWLRGHARPMRQEDGGTLWHGFVTDITERKAIDEALLASERRSSQQLRELVNIYTHTPVGLFAVDRELKFLRVNDRLADINGKTIDEHLGRTIDEVLPPQLAADLKEIWRPVLERGESVTDLELQGVVWWSLESPRHWLASYHPLLSDAGEVVGLMGTVLDITERKQMQDQLEKLTRELSIIFETAPIGIAKVVDRKQISVNRKIEEMSGYKKEQLVPQSTRMLYPSEEEYQAFGEDAYPVLARGEVYESERELLRVDGSRLIVKYVGKAVAPYDLSQGSIWTLEDITQRKEAENALRLAYEVLEQRVQERTAQLLSANRELQQRIKERTEAKEAMDAKQTVLDGMTMDLALAQERERRRIAAELHDQVGQVLLLARIKLGVLAGSDSSAPIKPMVDEIKGLTDAAIRDIRSLTFQLSPQLLCAVGLEAALEWLCRQLKESYGLQVDFCDDQLSKPVSEEMRHVVFQAVRELLINVRKHAQVEQASLLVARAGEKVRITVEDRGVGFDAGEQRIGKDADVGFGLFTSGRRIEHLGGTLTVATRPGHGTRVEITVPVLAAG
jgi:PAS domain S-box-containing protein